MKMPDNDISEMNLNGIKILANMKRQDTQWLVMSSAYQIVVATKTQAVP